MTRSTKRRPWPVCSWHLPVSWWTTTRASVADPCPSATASRKSSEARREFDAADASWLPPQLQPPTTRSSPSQQDRKPSLGSGLAVLLVFVVALLAAVPQPGALPSDIARTAGAPQGNCSVPTADQCPLLPPCFDATMVWYGDFIRYKGSTTTQPNANADRAELDELRAEDVDFIEISGYDHLCLFNSFAHNTELRPAELRFLVCQFMQSNPTKVVADDGMTVRDFVAFENSTMCSLNVATMREDGAGLAVAASLATMLGRSLEVYQRKEFNGERRQGSENAYVQILKVTADHDAPVLMLRFSPGVRVGHYDIMTFRQPADGRYSAAANDRQSVKIAQPVSTNASPKPTKMTVPEKPSLMKKPPSKRAPAKRNVGVTRDATAATRQRVPDEEGLHDDNDVSSVGVDRPISGQSSGSIWGETLRKQELLKPPLPTPATKVARSTQGHRVLDRRPTRPGVKRDRYFEDEEVTAGSTVIEVYGTM